MNAKTFRQFLRVLFTPGCWIQNHDYSPQWDHELRRLMAEHEFEEVDGYTAKLGPRILWVENHPYASMRPYDTELRLRARRITILEAYDKLIADTVCVRAASHLKRGQETQREGVV